MVAEILLKDPDNRGIFHPSAVFDFRCLEKVLHTVKTKSASAASKIIAVDCLDLKKALQLSSAIHCIEIHSLARPSRNSNLPEVITLFHDRLEENTLEELKYFCKNNLLPTSGSKSQVIDRVENNLRKRKLEVTEIKVKSPKLSSQFKKPTAQHKTAHVTGISSFFSSAAAPPANNIAVPPAAPVSKVVIKEREVLKSKNCIQVGSFESIYT